jgi:hypothetical protein
MCPALQPVVLRTLLKGKPAGKVLLSCSREVVGKKLTIDDITGGMLDAEDFHSLIFSGET